MVICLLSSGKERWRQKKKKNGESGVGTDMLPRQNSANTRTNTDQHRQNAGTDVVTRDHPGADAGMHAPARTGPCINIIAKRIEYVIEICRK